MNNFNLMYKLFTCDQGHKTWVPKADVQGRVPMGSDRLVSGCQRCLEMKNEEADKKLLEKNCSEGPSWMLHKKLSHA